MKRRQRDALDYFRFDAVAWLTSPAVSVMTPAQEGAFVRLLAYQARTKDCSLPASDEELSVLSRLGEEWATAGAFVRAQFVSDKDSPGRIFNKKLRNEWLAAWAGYKRRKSRNLRHRKDAKSETSHERLRDVTKKTRDVSPLLRTGTGTGAGTVLEITEKQLPAKPEIPSGWSREACDDWVKRFKGTAPGGQIGKNLKPLVERHGWPFVRAAWLFYLSQSDAEYASPSRFAQTFGKWSAAVGPTPSEQAERVAERMAAPRIKALEPSRAATPEELRAAQNGDAS